MEFQEALGALWEKTSKKGNHYLSGTLTIGGETIKINVFANTKKTDKHPDWKIYEQKPLEQ